MCLVGAVKQAEKEDKDKSGKSPNKSGRSRKKRGSSEKDKKGRLDLTSPNQETLRLNPPPQPLNISGHACRGEGEEKISVAKRRTPK